MMIKGALAGLIAVIFITLGVLAYSFFKTPVEAQAPIVAVPIVLDENTQSRAGGMASELVLVTTQEAEATGTEENFENSTGTGSEVVMGPEISIVGPDEIFEPATGGGAETVLHINERVRPAGNEAEIAAGNALTVFEIVPANSEVRFIIGEIFKGSPYRVVGATNQVAAEFAINANDLSSAQIGPVLVNARALTTGNDFGNRAIKNQILATGDYEFITFIPTGITNLSGRGIVGKTYHFQIGGDLTIRDVTRPVTFEVTATAVSESQLEGFATATILYADYNLPIPDMPQMAAVDDEVVLEIDFLAAAKNQPNPS